MQKSLSVVWNERNRSAAEGIVEIGPIADIAREDGVLSGEVVVHASNQVVFVTYLCAALLNVADSADDVVRR